MSDAKTYGCEECRSSSQDHLQLVSTNDNEYLGGKAYDTVKRYQCAACGAIWQSVVGGGLGGTDNYWGPAE